MNVLVVDDEPNMRTTLSRILQDEGYETSVAATGAEAVACWSARRFDVILLDVHLPDADGVALFRTLRRTQPEAKVILMSAYGTDELREGAIACGAIAFLPKPLDVERLLALMAESRDEAVLVVCNDSPTIAASTEALRRFGYRVSTAGNPFDALALMGHVRFDLIFIDSELPGMSGLDLVSAVRGLCPAVVAVMLADDGSNGANGSAGALEARRRAGFAVVRKPLDLPALLGLLQATATERAAEAVRVPPPDPP